MSELIRPSRRVTGVEADREDNLGRPAHGDETSALGQGAPTQTAVELEGVAPAARRIGEGLTSDSQNFQGRPSTSMVEGGGSTGAGGGSGL